MAKRGRKPGFTMPEDQRSKISKSQILNRLIKFSLGEVEMAPHAVTASIALLRKVLPDLASLEAKIEHSQPFAVIPEELPSIEAWEQSLDTDKPN